VKKLSNNIIPSTKLTPEAREALDYTIDYYKSKEGFKLTVPQVISASLCEKADRLKSIEEQVINESNNKK
jgi:hypothetical protein